MKPESPVVVLTALLHDRAAEFARYAKGQTTVLTLGVVIKPDGTFSATNGADVAAQYFKEQP